MHIKVKYISEVFDISMVLPPKELLGKFDFISGSVVLKSDVEITEKEMKLLEEYKISIENIQNLESFKATINSIRCNNYCR